MSKPWPKPGADWLPLAQAIFRFGMRCSGPDQSSGTVADRVDELPSQRELEELLHQRSGAQEALIDPATATFRFVLDGVWVGPPWEILSEPVDASLEPRVEAEALFNKGEGLTLLSDEEAAQQARHTEAIRAATGLVWRQYMVRAFDRAVSSGRVTLYARPEPNRPFEVLPADVWPLVEVVDWANGRGQLPEGRGYWSIHASAGVRELADLAETRPSRSPKREAAACAIRELYPDGVPDAATEINAVLCGKVGDWLKANNKPDVSNDTILRAAGRLK